MKKITLLLLLSFFIQENITAQYVYGEEAQYYAPKFEIKTPLKNSTVHFSNYNVSTEKPSIVQHTSGTKISIPKNAFVNKDGTIVQGDVDLKFREFNNPLDIYLSGIPMTVEQAGKKEFFQSAGMVELRASKDGEELFPNPNGEMITIELTSSQLDDDFQLYNLDEGSGEWVENGKDEVLWNSKENSDEQTNLENINFNQFPSRPPTTPFIDPSYTSVHIFHWNSKKKRRKRNKQKHFLEFTIETSTSKHDLSDPKKIIKAFPELRNIKNTVWVYEGKEKKETATFLSKIYSVQNGRRRTSNSKSKYELEDIIITPNFEKDNYLITFKCKGIKKAIEASPEFSTYSQTVEQKRHKKFYEKYLKKYKARCEDWKNLEKIHETEMAKYEVDLSEYQQVYIERNLRRILSPQQISNGVTRRSIEAYTFGVLNIDKLMKQLDEQMLVEFNLENDTLIYYSNVVVFDQTNNAMLSFQPNEKIRFQGSGDNSLLVILENNEGAIISSDDFKAAFNNRKKGKLSFTVSPIGKDKFNKKILSDALVSN